MKQKIGHFEIHSKNSVTKIKYTRTLKDWFDILGSLFIALLCLSIVIFLLFEISKGFEWIYTCIIFIFGITAYSKASYSIVRFLEPTNELIKIDRNKGLINVRLTKFKKIELRITELSFLIYYLNKDIIQYSNSIIKKRYWIGVEILTKNNELIKILTINPSSFFQEKDNKTEEALFKHSKILIDKISNELGIKSRHKGKQY